MNSTVPEAAARAAVTVAARLGIASTGPVVLRRLHLTIWYALYAERLPELRPGPPNCWPPGLRHSAGHPPTYWDLQP